jgi:2,5-diketo-D-gluconate reductase A
LRHSFFDVLPLIEADCMTTVPSVYLNDGRKIPQLGFGTWQISDAEMRPVVETALAAGYRSIDTAAAYGNEQSVGAAIRASNLARNELFVTTKVWNDCHGYDATRRAFAESLKRLGLEYVDLYLIHWPVPKLNLYVDSWRALVKLQEEGLAKSIGVSNFNESHLSRIIKDTGYVPAVNQIELHPGLKQKKLREFHDRYKITTESWSPLGQGKIIADKLVAQLAAKHAKTPAQIILRWHIQQGLVAIPKSANLHRLRENIAIFDFRLDPDDMEKIEKLRDDERIGPDPESYPHDVRSFAQRAGSWLARRVRKYTP